MSAFKWGLVIGTGLSALAAPMIYAGTKAGVREITLANAEMKKEKNKK